MRKLIDSLAVSLTSFILIALADHAWAQEDQDDLDYRAQQRITAKMGAIVLDHVNCKSVPFSDFLDLIEKKAKEQDPDHKGITLYLEATHPPTVKLNMSLDDVSLAQLITIVCQVSGLHPVFKPDGIHLTDAPIAPLIDHSPVLHEIIDKLNKGTYLKCVIISTFDHDLPSVFNVTKQQANDLESGDTVEYVMRGLGGATRNGFDPAREDKEYLLDLLQGFKIAGRGDGTDLDIQWVIIFYNKDGSTDEMDLNEAFDQGTWNGRKLVASPDAKKAVNRILANLQPPRLEE